MAIQQNKKQSDLEKRLQLLRRQVYGKEENKKSTVYSLQSTAEVGSPASQRLASTLARGERKSEVLTSDLTFLHQDLLKILIFASFAIGGQAILFLLVKNNVFTLNFF